MLLKSGASQAKFAWELNGSEFGPRRAHVPTGKVTEPKVNK